MTGIHYKKRFLKGLFIALRILTSYKLAPFIGIVLSTSGKRTSQKTAQEKRCADK